MFQALKRLYLMAHAPAEPQPWFQPKLAFGVYPPVAPNAPADPTPEERIELEGLSDFLGVEDCKQPRVREFAERTATHRVLMRQYTVRMAYLRLAQWPAAWADAVLKESK